MTKELNKGFALTALVLLIVALLFTTFKAGELSYSCFVEGISFLKALRISFNYNFFSAEYSIHIAHSFLLGLFGTLTMGVMLFCALSSMSAEKN